ncbi:MAG: hypothetical protein Q4F65_12205 [Propionibacteriaceae bacterium]|nr:hypothetical protein [Propionibacteriaceae bacterium]
MTSIVCPDSPAYVPPHELTARQRIALEASGRAHVEPCTALDGDCDCTWCGRAALDGESPLDLGGRWVVRRGVRR